jgi:hypothetical protein
MVSGIEKKIGYRKVFGLWKKKNTHTIAQKKKKIKFLNNRRAKLYQTFVVDSHAPGLPSISYWAQIDKN